MRPEQTFQLSLNFASGASPLWLLALLPAVLLLAGWLYRREIGAMDRRRRHTLYALRLILLAAVCFGLFMPELGIVRNLLYRGRIVFLLDNSESMLANDSSMPAADALESARAFRDGAGSGERQTSAGESFFRFSRQVQEGADRLREYRRDLARIGRDHPEMAKVTQRLLDRAAIVFLAIGTETPHLPVDRLPPELREEPGAVWLGGGALKREWDELFSAGTPSSQDVDKMCARFEEAIAACRQFQRDIDRQELEANGEGLRSAAAAVVAGKRLDLARGQINRVLPAVRQWTPGQYLQVADLMDGETRTLKKGEPLPDIRARRGRTDLLARLDRLVNEPHDFPLSGVVVVSDGVDWSTLNADAMLQTCVRKRIPLFCAGTGHGAEPLDMAIERLSVAPIGVRGQPVSVGVHVKAAVPLPVSCTLAIVSEGRELLAETVELRHPRQIVYLPVTPGATGFHRYEVELRAAGPDLFKERNNRSEFVLDVRERPVRVLLLDDRPRWQTRFALNILSRLPYVDLNPIIRVSAPDGVVKRGLDRGMWPDTAAGLGIYDLIVLGRCEESVLGAKEWDQVMALVVEGGKTLALIAPGDFRNLPESVRRWLPVAESGPAAPAGGKPGEASDLRVTPEGALHPLARRLGEVLSGEPFPGERLQPGALALLHRSGSGRPVVSCRYAGKGKVFLLDDDRLWKELNQQYLSEHGAMFVGLVDWSLRPLDNGAAVDQNVLLEGERFQVGFGEPGRQAVLSDESGAEIARAASVPAASSRGLHRAVLAPPLPGRYRLRTGPDGQPAPVFVLPDNAELTRLAMDADYLRRLASMSGGEFRALAEVERFFPGVPLKERREVQRYVFKMWSSQVVLLGLLILLSVEWVLRKYWRLV